MSFNPKQITEIMRKRTSVRSFSEKDIPNDILEDIIKTGLTAASGGNLQPYSIIVVKKQEKKEKLFELCGQPFIKNAPVNLIFLLDWHKMREFTEIEDAPFVCTDSYMHYLIAIEDLMCTAQIIETAAHLHGIGSCYVGTPNHCGDEIIKEFNLPKETYPVLMLSIGYPKTELKPAKKLDYDFMVFNEDYPNFTQQDIKDAFYKKYNNPPIKLANTPDVRDTQINDLYRALCSTYNQEKSDNIIATIKENNCINEKQRRFGLHYHATDLRKDGENIIKMMENQGFTPFHTDKY